jgi:hypothetical protein
MRAAVGEDRVLLASCLGEAGGGLVAVDGTTVERLDHLSSTGLAMAGPTRLVRALQSPGTPDSAADLLVYAFDDQVDVGRRGVGNLRRDPHPARLRGERVTRHSRIPM